MALCALLLEVAACGSGGGNGIPTIPEIPDARLASACSSAVPTVCAGMTYTILECSGLCSATTVYFLCDGTGFTSFACSQPAAPWSVWSAASALDAAASH